MNNSSEFLNTSHIRRDQFSQIRGYQKQSKDRTLNKSIFNVSYGRQDRSEQDEQKVIWGTNLSIEAFKKQFLTFIKTFHP